MTSKLITVFGATGQQGGAVVRGLQAKGGYIIRGITRNPDGEKAKALQGVELVKADLDDAASIEGAIAGSYGVFLVTNYWEFMNKDREIEQGKRVADACKKVGVKHVVYSGLESVKDIMGLDCPHFDGKGEVEKYLDSTKIPNTSVRLSAYYSAFFMLAQKQGDSYNYPTIMEGPMDGVAVEDIGPAVASIFGDPDGFIGKKVGLAGDRLTIEEYAATVTKITGIKVNVHHLTTQEYEKLFKGADDIAAMFQFYSKGNPDRNIVLTKQLNPDTLTFAQWVEQNKDKF
jgi:uncharacterized protein YbjT (DUF2867 family)